MLIRLAITLLIFCGLSAISVSAQTSAFTYQGRLSDSGTQPTATYDMEFKLFDALEGGNQLPQPTPITITFSGAQGVSVANGVFTVQLDFSGAAAFDGNARWLQIAVKKPTDTSFVTLSPRQPITSTPYAITATNSSQLDGRAASDYVLTTDSRMNDARTPTAGSGDYIQNNTSSQPQTSSFNISGNGAVVGTLSAGIVSSQSLTSPTSELRVEGGGALDLFTINRRVTALQEFRANQGVSTNGVDTPFGGFGELSLGNLHATSVKIGGGSTNLATVNITGNSVNINSGPGGADSVHINGSSFQSSTITAATVKTFSLASSSPGDQLNIGQFNTAGVLIHKPTTVSGLLTANSGISTNTETISGDLTVGGTINGTVATANNALNLGGIAASQYVQTTDSRLSDARSPLSGSDNYIQNTTNEQPANFNIFGNATIRGSSTGAALNLTGTQPLTPSANAPDVLRVVGGKGGNHQPGGGLAGGKGGSVLIQAGDGGDSSTSYGGPGGSITLQPGALGNGPLVAFAPGNVLLAPFGGNVGIGTSGLYTSGPRSTLQIFKDAQAPDTVGGDLILNRYFNGNEWRGASLFSYFPNAHGHDVLAFGVSENTTAPNTIAAVKMVVSANGNVGIGTVNPVGNLHINGPSSSSPISAMTIDVQSFQSPANAVASYFLKVRDLGSGSPPAFLIRGDGNVGIGTPAPDNTLTVNGSADKPGGGSWGTFSDERLKNIKGRFAPGLKAVMQLQPLRYEYKPDNALGIKSSGEHIGFSAQAVEKIVPEAVSKNDKGYLLVNNDPILWTMLNAVKEQQTQIEDQRTLIQSQQKLLETQQRQIEKQQRQVDGLGRLVCSMNAGAEICREK